MSTMLYLGLPLRPSSSGLTSAPLPDELKDMKIN